MMRVWVVNASPLILLGRIEQIDLLVDLCDDLVVPEAVAKEVMAGPPHDPARQWLVGHHERVVMTRFGLDPRLLAWDLGAGETSVLGWAFANPEAVCVLDDRAARTCARAFALPCMGTLGVLLAAKQAGRIERVAPLLDGLKRAGSLLSPAVAAECLRRAGEV